MVRTKPSAVALLAALLIAAPIYASERYCAVEQGPAGPAGPQGAPGARGVMGYPGVRGPAGSDAEADSSHAYFGVEGLWHEWDNHVGLRSGIKKDVVHGGFSADIAVVQVRFGKSPEDRRIDALTKELEESRKTMRVLLRHASWKD